MSICEQIKKDADDIWTYLKGRPRIFFPDAKDFSPQSLWTIERFFEACSGKGVDKGGSPFDVIDHTQIQFQLGAYIGEVVRRHYGEKCTWNCDEVFEDKLELRLPDKKLPPLFPMRFIGEQIRSYKQGSIVEWGSKAGLNVGKQPPRPQGGFR
jgi:hypothetical protein